MGTNFGKVVTYHKEVPLIKLPAPSITCLFEVTSHIKYFLSPLALDQWQSNMAM